MDRFAIARALREIGRLLELKGESVYKARAYEKAARALEEQAEDVAVLVREGRLTDIEGIGEATAARIRDLHASGRTELLDTLRAEFPPGVLELAEVPEVGPKKAIALNRALGITSVAGLKSACEAGLVQGLKGFGAKTEQKILEGIARHETRRDRILLVDALATAEPLLAHVRASPAVARADLAGSLRRWRETVADVDLVVAAADADAAMAHFASYPLVEKVESRGGTKCTVRLAGGLQVDLRAVGAEDYWTALHHFTGSQRHHVKLRGLARDRGLTISEYGVVRIEGGEKLPVADEAALYAHLGLPYIPPELREDEGELEAAQAGATFDDLVRIEDVRGMVHAHTTYSDGRASIEEMARAADALGMEYLTITDHSPAASYAGGVTVDRLKAQWDEIERVQESVRVKLLRGTESDILEDGALDYPDDVLERFDVVIASVHQRHRMDASQMTRRLVRAMSLPVFKIWGHALGRLLQKRDPFECDMDAVLDAIAGSRAAVEVNGDPYRLDMEPRWLREARKRGIRFVISTDAHSIPDLRNLRFGVHTARRGGVRRGEVLNALAPDAFRAAVRPAS